MSNTDERESDMDTIRGNTRTRRTATELEKIDEYAVIADTTFDAMDERLRYVNIDAIASMTDDELHTERDNAGPAEVFDAIHLELRRRGIDADLCQECGGVLIEARPNTAGWFGVYKCDNCGTFRQRDGSRHPNAVRALAIEAAEVDAAMTKAADDAAADAAKAARKPDPPLVRLPAKERRYINADQLAGEFSKGAQNVKLEATWKIGPELVRITIERDAYDFQSSAVADMFDPTGRKWNRVAALPWATLASLRWSYVQGIPEPEQAEETFYVDMEELLRRVCLIVAEAPRPRA